uniref:Uncharacterized protein n=1 Tax=Pithovirus LCDPAC02 TaxID=2506601 RepID=A0A481YRT7_9VIRU|nr:MAG: hypothetical protein LCDPAC02_03650 [Pithovirus LCDPAC02]
MSSYKLPHKYSTNIYNCNNETLKRFQKFVTYIFSDLSLKRLKLYTKYVKHINKNIILEIGDIKSNKYNQILEIRKIDNIINIDDINDKNSIHIPYIYHLFKGNILLYNNEIENIEEYLNLSKHIVNTRSNIVQYYIISQYIETISPIEYITNNMYNYPFYIYQLYIILTNIYIKIQFDIEFDINFDTNIIILDKKYTFSYIINNVKYNNETDFLIILKPYNIIKQINIIAKINIESYSINTNMKLIRNAIQLSPKEIFYRNILILIEEIKIYSDLTELLFDKISYEDINGGEFKNKIDISGEPNNKYGTIITNVFEMITKHSDICLDNINYNYIFENDIIVDNNEDRIKLQTYMGVIKNKYSKLKNLNVTANF